MEIYKKIIVTGANGFTGRFVCKELLKRNINFSVILRPGQKKYTWIKKNNIDYFYADLNDFRTLSNVLKGFDSIISVASLGFGSVDNIINSCKKVGIKRAIFVSSTSIFTTLNAKSKGIRIEAEKKIKKSNLIWTIVRPTMIYGTPNDRNMIRLINWINIWPIIPIFGDGSSLQQPVYVEDLASALVCIFLTDKTYFKSYNISGKSPLSFSNVIDIISNNLEKKIIKIFIPYKPIIKILNFFEYLNIYFPISSEQILRINENKSFPHRKAFKDFGFQPRSFEQGIINEIKLFKKII